MKFVIFQPFLFWDCCYLQTIFISILAWSFSGLKQTHFDRYWFMCWNWFTVFTAQCNTFPLIISIMIFWALIWVKKNLVMDSGISWASFAFDLIGSNSIFVLKQSLHRHNLSSYLVAKVMKNGQRCITFPIDIEIPISSSWFCIFLTVNVIIILLVWR